jgi:o-succinylbenzoate synthase
MKIIEIEIIELALPMIHSFETSFGRIGNKHTLLVKLFDEDGNVGYGEAPALQAPVISYETTDTCFYILENFLAPAVIKKHFQSIEELVGFYDPILGHPIAKTGLQNAVWHLMAQQDNQSLKALLKGEKEKIPVGESIGIKPTIEKTLEEIELRLRQGYRRTKVKIKPGWDVQVISDIRKQFGDIDLMADANSAYHLGHLNILKALDEFHLMMIEQPLAHDDILDHATLQKQIRTPVCLDESIKSVEDARKAIDLGACKVINIKPARLGGLLESKQVHDLCQKRGIGVWCGGMLETGIGRAFNIALASLPNFQYPADMSPYYFYYSEDLVDPSYDVDKEGYIPVPDSSGLGYNIADSKIQKYTVKRMIVS